MKKNKKPLIITILVVLLALIISILVCSSKGYKIHKLEKFTDKVEQEFSNYSPTDLDKAQAKFEKLVKRVEKKNLSGDDLTKVNTLKGNCKGYFAQAKARMILKEFQENVNAAGDEVKGIIESMQ